VTSLEDFVRSTAKKLERHGILIKERRALTNGIRVIFQGPASSCGMNFYHSKKRGFSLVPAGGDAELAGRIRNITDSSETEPSSGSRIGSDEAGKGDYMGPLTVAAVYHDSETSEFLSGSGIRDSKTISDGTLRNLASAIRSNLRGRYAVTAVPPLEYNRRLDQLTREGRNSLDLLAQCHAKVLGELLEKLPEPETVIIDKFCDEKRIVHLLPGGSYRLELRERAESDPAVAAASILARDEYLRGLDGISEEYGIRAVPGSGRTADDVAGEFVRKFGSDVLYRIAKVHFRNTSRANSLFN
jgi:ribonuclease HIII